MNDRESKSGIDVDAQHEQERQNLLARRDSLADTFDKSRVALSGAAIAFSFAGVKERLGILPPTVFWIFVGRWILLALCLLISLAVIMMCMLAYDRQIDILDEVPDAKDPYSACVPAFNVASVVALAAGLCLCGYALVESIQVKTPEQSPVRVVLENK